MSHKTEGNAAAISAGPSVWLVPLILVFCTAVSTLSTDLYAPSMPHLVDALRSDRSTVQLTMSLNLAAYAVAQLVHGPLADRFGRRALLLAGWVGFTIASAACALSVSIESLIAGRIAQGLFSSVPSVVVLLIIRELFDERQAVRILGLYGIGVGVAPAIGPLIGGYIFLWLGWRANFWALAIIAILVALAVLCWIPETKHASSQTGLQASARAYWRLGKNSQFLRFLAPLAGIYGAFFAFVTNGPFILIERLGVRTERYGVFYALLVLAFIAGSFCANRLAGRVSTKRLADTAVALAVLGATALAVPVFYGVESLGAMVASMMIITASLGLIFASAPILMLDATHGFAPGPASALLGSLQLACASLGGLIVGEMYDGTAAPLVSTVAGFISLSATIYILLGSKTWTGMIDPSSRA